MDINSLLILAIFRSFYNPKLLMKIKQIGLLWFSFLGVSQTLVEQLPPDFIQTVILSTDGMANNVPIINKGDVLYLSFDDLRGAESTYYYEIVRAEADWSPTELFHSEYMKVLTICELGRWITLMELYRLTRTTSSKFQIRTPASNSVEIIF